uniref:Putative secreted peptide n=1 Tax=Anopheles braziliensis TaxID=58242 RepID=A0A2M3ZUC3_9DIPT
MIPRLVVVQVVVVQVVVRCPCPHTVCMPCPRRRSCSNPVAHCRRKGSIGWICTKANSAASTRSRSCRMWPYAGESLS